MENENSKRLNIKELDTLSFAELLRYKDAIIAKRVPVWRKTGDGRFVIVPVNRIEQYTGENQKEQIVFYIQKKWKENDFALTIESSIPVNNQPTGEQLTPYTGEQGEQPAKRDIYEELATFDKMNVVEREEILDQSIGTLIDVEKKGSIDNIEAVIKMVDVIINSFYANYANLKDNLASANLSNNMIGVYNKTEWIIQIIVRILQNTKIDYSLMQKLFEISTASHTLDHINKVFLIFSMFIVFYNEYIEKGMVSKNLRVSFKNRYLMFYKRRFPDENITVERVFKRGIKRIDSSVELANYLLGALLFDIGKIPDLEYHDSMEEYNESIVKKHVLNGYNMIIKAKDYPFVVSSMAAFHHEYYFGSESYQFTDPLLSKITRKPKSEIQKLYLITYDEDEFKQGEAIAFFPCKVLEVIDVFDALFSKKQNTVFQAITIMKKEFIAKNLKIDPVLFDIFLQFLISCGLLQREELKKIDEIKF